MKNLLLLLVPFVGLALGAEDCQCPQVKCPGEPASALCECLNNAEALCADRCPDYVPDFQICPKAPSMTKRAKPKPTKEPVCTCDDVFCAAVWPESCFCQNDAKKACFEKCGGVEPEYQTCPEQKAKREALPAKPTKAPKCTCDEVFCAAVWPESCFCQNDAKKACFEKCGGVEPEYQTCPVEKRAPPPKPTKTPTCTCDEVFCAAVWPESCFCQNDAKKACFDKCGGVEPEYQTCPEEKAKREALPAKPTKAPKCTCDEVFCAAVWPESCFCQNDAKKACFDKCGGVEPEYQTCPEEKAKRVALPAKPTKAPTCTCDAVFCAAVWPESCFCQNDAKKACFEKCGGVEPEYQTCPVSDSAGKRAPPPKPTKAPTCTCEEVSCAAVWPESCFCQNDAKKACFEKCGGVEPEYQTCPEPEAVTKRAEEAKCTCDEVSCAMIWPESCICQNNAKKACFEKCGGVEPEFQVCEVTPEPTCECEQVFCPQVWPQSCYCQNAAKANCFAQCGGVEPEYQMCPEPTTLEPVPSPTTTAKYKRCGGGRGNNIRCGKGEVCIAEPGTCGPACDQFGVCVKDKMCGGFAGFACPKGQTCVDDPRDDCDPNNGGSDCAGLCY